MALRDRQISGIPLTEGQSEILSHMLTALVPVLGYTFWYPKLGIPEELWPWLAVVGVLVHLAQSAEIVPNNVVRNLLWMGAYTGESFSNGIKFLPRIPFPLFLLLVRVVFGEEFYRKILWSLGGDVAVRSILARFVAEGLALGGVRVRITGTIRIEVVQAATYASQTADVGEQGVKDAVVARYADTVKSSVIAQHTPHELMRGYHSGGSKALAEWMTETWKIEHDFGVELEIASLDEVKILSEQLEQAFDRVQAEELLVSSAESLAQAFARFRTKNPELSEEVAWTAFAASQGMPGTPISIVKFK